MFRRFRLVHFDDTPGFGRWFLKVFEWQTVMQQWLTVGFQIKGIGVAPARLTAFPISGLHWLQTVATKCEPQWMRPPGLKWYARYALITQ